jgi:hypothetical protein
MSDNNPPIYGVLPPVMNAFDIFNHNYLTADENNVPIPEEPIDPQLGDDRDVLLIYVALHCPRCIQFNDELDTVKTRIKSTLDQYQREVSGFQGLRIITVVNNILNTSVSSRFVGLKINCDPPNRASPMFAMIDGRVWNEAFKENPSVEKYGHVRWTYFDATTPRKEFPSHVICTTTPNYREHELTYVTQLLLYGVPLGSSHTEGLFIWLNKILSDRRSYYHNREFARRSQTEIEERGPMLTMSPFWVQPESGLFTHSPRYIQTNSLLHLNEEMAYYVKMDADKISQNTLFNHFRQCGITEYFNVDADNKTLIKVLIRFVQVRRERYQIAK